MPQFPGWKQPLGAVTDAVQLRQSQVRQALSDLATRGRDTSSDISARAVDIADRTRYRIEEIPRAAVDELRRRINVLELATKRDVEVQSKLGRNRVSLVVKEFLEAQRQHDEHLLELLRAELREQLQSFAAALDDDVIALDAEPKATRRAHDGLDDFDDNDDDDDDDEINLVSYDDPTIYDSVLDTADG